MLFTLTIAILGVVLLLIAIFVIELIRYLDCNYNWKNIRSICKLKASSPIIISLTTIPERINYLGPTLYSLLRQTIKPRYIQLNIPYICRGEKYKIPLWLRMLDEKGIVRINRIRKDLGPSSKLLPTLKTCNKKDLILVVDDDMIYGSKLIENLLQCYRRNKGKKAITVYGQKYRRKETKLSSIRRFIKGNTKCYRLYGVGGYLLRADMLSEGVWDYSSAPKEARNADDNWISGWLRKNNVEIYMMGLRSKSMFLPNIYCIDTLSLSGSVNRGKEGLIKERKVDAYFE